MTVKETAEYDNFLGKKEELVKPAALFEIEENEESEREKLWVGMPEFEQKDNPPFKTIYVHFRNKEDFDEFVDQLLMFPTSNVHDDLVDALSYIDQLAVTSYSIDNDEDEWQALDVVSGY